MLRLTLSLVVERQRRSQEFTKGGQTRGYGDGSPQRGPGAEYGNSKEHQRGRDKKMTYGDRGDMHPCPPLATPLLSELTTCLACHYVGYLRPQIVQRRIARFSSSFTLYSKTSYIHHIYVVSLVCR